MDEISYAERQRRNQRFRVSLIANPTRAELIVGEYLSGLGVRFLFQKGLLKPFHRIVDFYIPGPKSKRLIIEVDGASHEGAALKDGRKDETALFSRSMRTVRVTNEQVYSGEFKSMLSEALGL